MAENNAYRTSVEESFADVVEEKKHKEPSKYAVFMHNDDYTTQEFVVLILIRFFYFTEEKAMSIMFKIHTEGTQMVGVFTKDIALSKIQVVTDFARKNGMPLSLSCKKLGK